jgi:iron complex outermembrane recepter protein
MARRSQRLLSKVSDAAAAKRRSWQPTNVLTLLLLAAMGHQVLAESTPSAPTTDDLKQLSLEQLMGIQVTSVSKQPQKLLQAASAIQVITGEDIRRSGATSIPEALRLADNLEVAQENSHDWAISARGSTPIWPINCLC